MKKWLVEKIDRNKTKELQFLLNKLSEEGYKIYRIIEETYYLEIVAYKEA